MTKLTKTERAILTGLMAATLAAGAISNSKAERAYLAAVKRLWWKVAKG